MIYFETKVGVSRSNAQKTRKTVVSFATKSPQREKRKENGADSMEALLSVILNVYYKIKLVTTHTIKLRGFRFLLYIPLDLGIRPRGHVDKNYNLRLHLPV
jgi:hypothetical protein